jgi:hypothetical protein
VLRNYWRARILFDVSASDFDMACHQTFAVFVEAYRAAQEARIGQIWRPVVTLKNPNLMSPVIERCLVRYPPPKDTGEKTLHQVGIDLQYVKIKEDWRDAQEARAWLAETFRAVETPVVQLSEIRDSFLHWN